MSRIIIKGLSVKTNLDFLKKHFSLFGTISDLKIIKNKLGHKKNYIFIGFIEKNAAEKCLHESEIGFLENRKIKIEKAYVKKYFHKTDSSMKSTKEEEKTVFYRNLIEKIKETGQLFIRNLPLTCKEEEIEALFKRFGFISLIKILKPKELSKNSQQAIIGFGLPECAIKAGSFLDGKIFKGKILHIIPCKKKIKIFTQEKVKSSLGIFKKTRVQVEKNTFFNKRSWFWFFFPSDFLIKGLSSRFGSEKKQNLNYQPMNLNWGGLTISESRLQYEITSHMEKEGINFKTMDPFFLSKKSKKIFLVKNFSSQSLFFQKKTLEQFGKVNRCISFPLINLIFIEYKKKKDASIAFSKISILLKKEGVFLEWAPYNCIRKDKKKIFHPKVQSNKNLTDFKLKERNDFIVAKNIKRNSKNPHKKTKKILKTKKIPSLGNQVFFSDNSKFSKKIFTLLIRNLPFRVSISDLRKIFSSIGGVISIRMPKKKDGTFRGFAFVNFYSLEETKKALLLTQSVHIYSRRILPSIIM